MSKAESLSPPKTPIKIYPDQASDYIPTQNNDDDFQRQGTQRSVIVSFVLRTYDIFAYVVGMLVRI